MYSNLRRLKFSDYISSGLYLFLITLFLYACKNQQKVILDNSLLKELEKEQISSFYIPIKIAKKDIEHSINKQIGEVIYEEENLNNDNISVRATKVASIELGLKDSVITYTVPLNVWVQKRFRIGGSVEAEGALELEFETKYQLQADWVVQTETNIQKHEWIKKPKINVLGAKIPVGAIADKVLEVSKDKITATIDNLMKENLALKPYGQKAWDLLQQPILISKEYHSHLKLTPHALSINPFQLKKDTIVTTILIQGLSEVSVGEQGSFLEDAPLPPLKMQVFDTAPFQVRLLTNIPFDEAEKIAVANIKGEKYTFGKKEIKVEAIKMSKQADRLAVEVQVSGDYDGVLNFKGIPTYNSRKNRIDIKQLEFRLDTKNFLLKTAKWLFTDLIINKLEGNLQYTIDEELDYVKKQLQKQLDNTEIKKGIYLKGNVEDLKVLQAGIGDTSLEAAIEISGQIVVDIKDFL